MPIEYLKCGWFEGRCVECVKYIPDLRLSVHFKNVCLYLLKHCCNSCIRSLILTSVFFNSNICVMSGMLLFMNFFSHVEIFLFLHMTYNLDYILNILNIIYDTMGFT